VVGILHVYVLGTCNYVFIRLVELSYALPVFMYWLIFWLYSCFTTLQLLFMAHITNLWLLELSVNAH